VRLVKVVIWLATAFFVGMLFSPLVQQMVWRLTAGGGEGLP
jgi:hypothetical protein